MAEAKPKDPPGATDMVENRNVDRHDLDYFELRRRQEIRLRCFEVAARAHRGGPSIDIRKHALDIEADVLAVRLPERPPGGGEGEPST